MSAHNAGIFLASVSFGGTALDVPVDFAVMEEVDNIEIPGPADVGPTAQAIVRKRLIAEVTWIGTSAPFASYDGASTGGSSLVAVITEKNGTTRTITCSNMRPFGSGMSTSGVPFRWKQTFMYQGDYSSSPISW